MKPVSRAIPGRAMDNHGFATHEHLFHGLQSLEDFLRLIGCAVVGDSMLPKPCGNRAAMDGFEVVGGFLRDFLIGNESEDVTDPGLFDFIEEPFQ